jgi:hypothetical protein
MVSKCHRNLKQNDTKFAVTVSAQNRTLPSTA